MCKLIGCSHIEAAQERHLPVLIAFYSVQRLARLFAVQGSDCSCWIGLKVWQRKGIFSRCRQKIKMIPLWRTDTVLFKEYK